MPHKLVHPTNRPSIDIKEGGSFDVAIHKVRESLEDLLRTGALNVLANHAAESASDQDRNRVDLNILVGALLSENPISKILRNTDPFDKQNILTLALSEYDLPDDCRTEVPDAHGRGSSDTTRVIRRTPRPPNPLDR
jgi:hypothetical protein